MRKHTIALLLLALCISGYAQHPWENGQSETLWRHRYGNCDYGMFILLPNGVVGHGTLPPAPNHGIAVRLPDVGSTAEVDVHKENRYVWVNAEYNVSDDSSRKGTDEYYISLYTEGKHGSITKQVAKLGGLPATRLKIAYESPNGSQIEEVVFAQRGDIVYEIGLRTNRVDYTQDVHRFEQLMSGFRLGPLPKGQCSNG